MPELTSLLISILAFIFAFGVFLRERSDVTRMGDINALFYLRKARGLLYEAWAPDYEFDTADLVLGEVNRRRNKVREVLEKIEKRRDDIVSGLSDAIPTTSSRYRKDIYELAVRFTKQDVFHIVQYMVLKTDYYQLGPGWSMRAFMGLPHTKQDEKAHLDVGDLHMMIDTMMKRMETVYFDKPIESTILTADSS